MENLIRVQTAADLYGCDRRRIYQLIGEGRLKSIKLYNTILVDADEVLRVSKEITPRGIPRKNAKKMQEN